MFCCPCPSVLFSHIKTDFGKKNMFIVARINMFFLPKSVLIRKTMKAASISRDIFFFVVQIGTGFLVYEFPVRTIGGVVPSSLKGFVSREK